MKPSFSSAFAASLSAFALTVAVTAPASAADFPQRQALEAQSARSGLGVGQLPLLKRVPGPGKEAVAGEVLRGFGASSTGITTEGSFSIEADEDRYSLTGDGGWFLTVLGDGSRIHYSNQALLEARPELALPLEERLSQDALEDLGRQFVANDLKSFAQLSPGEKLVPSFTEFLVQGGGSTEPGGPAEREKVLASTVVFSRSVGGIAIVGPGSKIAVTFANDGTPVAFDVDWAQYVPTSQTQEVLPLGDILARSEVLGKTGAEETLDRIECGYFDLGSRKRDASALVQAGCFLQIGVETPSEGGNLVGGIVEAIPAGASVVADGSWPEAARLAGLPTAEGSPEPEAAPSL